MIVDEGWADHGHDQVGLAVLIVGGLVSMATNGFGNFESGLDSVCKKKERGHQSLLQVSTNWTI